MINESLLQTFLEGLVLIGPRKIGTYGAEKAAEYLYDHFTDMGLETRLLNQVRDAPVFSLTQERVGKDCCIYLTLT